jgi:nucleotide-binding universal stress UspA family protein
MYGKIMVPVDLAHLQRLGKALEVAADLAKHYRIPVCYVGVTVPMPNPVARTPQEHEEKLARFGAEQATKHGIEAGTAAYTSRDPSADLDKRLIKAASDTGSDLIVMASHVPGLPEHLFASNAGAVASHAKVSVFVVR